MITMDFVQHAIVAVAAMAAVGILLRRLVGAARPAPGAAPGCANCPSSVGTCQVAAPPAATPAARAEHPLVFVRPPRP